MASVVAFISCCVPSSVRTLRKPIDSGKTEDMSVSPLRWLARPIGKLPRVQVPTLSGTTLQTGSNSASASRTTSNQNGDKLLPASKPGNQKQRPRCDEPAIPWGIDEIDVCCRKYTQIIKDETHIEFLSFRSRNV
ncbi:hypothetical protein BJX68DRAFT_204063 [Aspergillus pseudodeflectus]|uniref:Uncharacterized protein n=1 Tax=Aspergillus pseudodeflectus TaxID=176178 RepID=A0ABR4KVE0_9EURO